MLDEFDPLVAPTEGRIKMFSSPEKCNWHVRILLVLAFAFMSQDLMALGPSPDERLKFKELMEVKWLACLFEPIATDSGEILEFIGYHPEEKRTVVMTSPPGESKIIEGLLEEDNPFSKPMTLVFDDAKTKVKLVYPSILRAGDNVPASSMIVVQKITWLTPGALLLFIPVNSENENTVLNLVVIPGKNTDGKFQAYMNYSYFGFIVIVSAQCSDEIDDDIMPELVKYRSELQAKSATNNQD